MAEAIEENINGMDLFTGNSLKKIIAVLALCLSLLVTVNILPVWADEITDSASISVCSSSGPDSEASSATTPDTPASEDPGSESGTTPETPAAEEPNGQTGATPETPAVEEPVSETGTTPETPAAEESNGQTGATPETPAAEEPNSQTGATPESPAAEKPDGETATTPETPAAEEPDSETEATPETPAVEEPNSGTGTTPDTPAVEDTDSENGAASDSPDAEGTGGGTETVSENPTAELGESLAEEVASIPQTLENAGDPWGYILNAVTETAVEGANVEVWRISADGSTQNAGIINEVNPVATDAAGYYNFTVKETADYQLKVSKPGYVDFWSQVYNFAKDAVTQVDDLYLVPLVTDVPGDDITIKHDLVTNGENISISANNITVNDNIIVDTRQIDDAGVSTGNSGSITMTGTESLTINTGAKVLAEVSAGSAFTPGTINLSAVNNTVHAFDLLNMTTPTTSATVTVKGSVSGGDVVIGASTGKEEIPEVVDIDDYSLTDWAIAKLQEYIAMIPLPVVVKMRDDQSTVTLDSGALITGNKVTIQSEANAQARAEGEFSKRFIGYCKARAQAEVNVNNGAVIIADDNVLIRSKALTAADLDVKVDNSKNSSFSLVLGVTDTDLTSYATIAQGADITGKNVNIQALGSNYNHVSTQSTNSTDGKLMAMLSLNFTNADVKTQVDGNLTASGDAINLPEDLNNRLSSGIGILARLESDDLARVAAGVGGTVADEREKNIDEEKSLTAKDMIINYFQQKYTQKTEEAQTNQKNDSGANKNLQAAAACSCSKVDNDVTAIVGSTADLKSGLDLNIKSELLEKAQTQTRSWVQGDSDEDGTTTSNAVSAAVSIGLYDNSATTTFAGQSDAYRNTVIGSLVSYPFLLQPFKDTTPGTFKNGIDLKDAVGQSLNFAKDVLGLLAEMINSWTASTASGETLGASGAVTYLEYNNNAAANIKNTARINQRAPYQSDNQTVAIDAATDLAQIIVVGNFDFDLSSSDIDYIATERYGDDYKNGIKTISDDNQKLAEPDGAATGKAGVGGSILLSYVNNNASANIENGARIRAGSNGQINVNATNQVTNMEFVQSGGEAGKFGVAGSFALDNETATVMALINRGTLLEAGALNIKAGDASSHLNILGGVMKGDGIGIGCSIGINQITRTVKAGIIEPDDSVPASTSNIVIAGAANVEAAAQGDILVAAVAASKPGKTEDEAPDQSKDTSDTTSTAPQSGSTGAGKSQGKYGIGVSGAVSINEVNDTVRAVVDYSDKLDTGSLTVNAANQTNILALTGSAAYTKSNQETSGTLAGAYSQVTLNGTTEASIIGTEMDTNALALIAERLGNLWAISAGGANSPGKSGIAVAGSVSINTIRNTTNATANGMKGNVLGSVQVSAKDKSCMHVIAGAEGYGGRGGFGAAVAYNDLQNNTKAQIINSNWTQTATLDLLAENSIRAGPIDESFDISGNPAANVEIFAIAASLGVSPKGNFGGAGTVAINLIRNTVEASMTSSVCTITGAGQATFTSRDDSNIFSIAGAIGGAKNVGIGAAVAYNDISNKAYSFIDGSTLNNPTALSLITESGGIIKTLSLGAAGAQDAALGGSASVNTVTNDASAYIKNSTVSVINNISLSSTGNAGIGSVAGGFAGAGKAAIGAAIAINNIGSVSSPNKIKAYIENATVITLAGDLSLAATSNSIIKSISAGGAGAEKCAIGGAVSVNNIINAIEAYIKDCSQGGKEVNAQNNITLDAVDNSVVSVIAGSVAGAGTAAIAGAASTISIGYYNPINKTTTYSKTGAYIENSKVTSHTGAITLTATSNSVIFNIAAGAGVAGTFGGQGSVCLNWIYNDLSALITNSTVTAPGNISAAAATFKRTRMPKGAVQPESDNTEIAAFDGNPSDTDNGEASGQATTHPISSIQALAGSVAGGGTAGVGLVVATNKIANIVSAGINGSTITSNQGNVKLTSISDATIEVISAALAAAGTFAGAGSVSLNQINNQTSSFIINSAVAANNVSDDLVNGQLPGVYMAAGDTSVIRSISGGIGVGGSAGLGGAAAYNEINNTIKAYVEGCRNQGGTDLYVTSSGSLTVKGESAAAIETISAGGAFGGYAGVAGSVSINTIGNTVEAYIKDSTADIDDNIYLLAHSDNTIHGYGGAMAGGLAGVSGAVVVNTVENTTRAYVLHSTVTVRGTGGNAAVKNWNDNGDESTEDLKGLFVVADCSDVVEMYSGAAAGGAGAVAGQTSVNHIKDTTEAFIGAANINSVADFGQWVKVKAHQGTQVDIWAGGLCVSGAGVGAAVDRTLVENTTRAFVSDSDESGTDPVPVDSVIYARGLEVVTRTREDVNPRLAGMALSGTASGAGAVSVVDFNSNNSAAVTRSSVFAQGPVNIYAVNKALLDSKAATFAASAGGSIAGSVVVNTLKNTVQASVLGSNLNSIGAIEVKSLGNDKIKIMTGGVGLGQGGIGGVVSFNTIEATTESAITNSGVRVSLINQDARFKPGGLYAPDANQTVLVKAENTSTVDNTGLAGGAGIYIGGGAAVDVTKVQNRTVAYVGAGCKVYGKGDINIEAQATKTIDSKTAAVGAGLVGISGAISIITLGEAVSNEGAGQFTGELRQQVNSDASVKNLKINTSDSTAGQAANKVNGLPAPSLDHILAVTQDTSGKITAAYVEDGTAAGAKAEIVSDSNVNIKAINSYSITGTRGQVAVGAIAAGASVTLINTYDRTKAFVGNYSTVRAHNLTVLADSTETAIAESYAAQAGLFAGGGNIAHVNIHPLVEASLGSYSNISALDQAAVTAAVKPQAKASVYGVTVTAGAKVAVADARAESTLTVNAFIGQNARVTCGYQPLGGNPVLTFSSGSQLTGSPTLTFTVKSVQMSGNPTLHFAPGAGGAHDTVSRNDSGSWNSDGFKVGDYISIDATDRNNAVYQITNISPDGKTLTLDTQGTVEAEDKSGANVYIERAGEIQRSTGSWYDDAFIEGEFILVSGTGSNDGYYEIGRIIDNNTLELDVSDEIQNQISSSANVMGDTADMIRRSTGSWLDDGFAAGQIIKVSGSANNDGQYTVKSISDDGKVLTLDSLNLFTKEQTSGVNITIVDYSDSGANTAGLKISAGESLPAAGNTAEAYAFGAGGALLSIDCTMASAKNTSAVAAWVANNANLTVAGTVEITADTATKQKAAADGYNFGGVQAGNNKAWASSSPTGEQLNITTAGLQDNVRVSALKLLISAYRTDENYAEAFAGSGGAFDLVLIEAQTENKAATRASMGTGAALDVDRLQMLADHTAKFNSKADAVSGALVGVGAGRANNQVDSTVEANIGPSGSILAREMTVNANNRTNKDWLSGYNVQSRSGGVLNFQAGESKTDITNTTNIMVGDNTSILIPGSIFNSGCLNMEILNSVLARDKTKIDISGAITGAKALSQINNTNTGTVQIGKNVTITSAGDINLSAVTCSNIETYALAQCSGAAGLANGDSKAVSTSTNNIIIKEGARITSYGQINLLAGQNSKGGLNACYSRASADVKNWTAVCLKTSPKASGIINLNNYLTIENASLRAVKDANLITEEGVRITDGTGTAKNLYSEFLGMDCRTIDTTIDVKSRAQVDGTIEVGIQNQQLLTIEADGTVSTITDGVTFIKTKYEMHTQLLEELEWARLMQNEYAGTAAEEAFKDEIIRLQGELIELGHQYDNNGVMEESVWADYIIVNDIWAQSSNINILAGTLTGSGTLQARGDAKIEIINKSPAYLRLGSLTIPESAGGKVVFNRSSLDSGLHNGVRIISGTSSGEPQITIRNTYTGGTQPDVELYGNVENRNGPLYVSSTGGITSKGDIRAGKVTLHATGDFLQSYVDTFYPVGGEPRTIWKSVTDITEQQKSLYWLNPHKADTAINQVLNAQPQSKIEAANVMISARYLNINGVIISGHPEQRLVLSTDMNSKIAGFWNNPHYDYHDNLIAENGGVKAYFDLITRRVIVEGVSAEGGYVSLFGQIMNTGKGSIEALDGYASIHIENHTNYDMVVGALDTGRGSEGMVVIKDTAPMTWLPGSYSAPVVTVYTRIGNQIQLWDSVDSETRNLIRTYSPDANVTYQPLAGLRYSWVTAQSKLTRTSITYRKSSWMGVDWLAKDPGNIYDQSTVILDSEPLLNGEYVEYRPDLTGSAYTYSYRIEKIARYDADGNELPELVEQRSWVKKKWWGKKTYYLKRVYERAYKDVNYHSIRADYPISITFKGDMDGTVDITSDHGLVLNGSIINPNGVTTVSARGPVEQTEGTSVQSEDITIIGDGGIGNLAAFSIDLKGGVLTARALQGTINIKELNGELKLAEVTNNNGNVSLSTAAMGNIIGSNAATVVTGRQISLTSSGGIGTINTPLLVNSGTNPGEGLRVQACNDIYLKKANGNINLIKITSDTGNVYVEAANGSILDTNSELSRGTLTEGFVLATWNSLSLSGQKTAADLRYLIGFTLKTDRKPDIWLEDLNVQGNNITLKALNGTIGQNTESLTIDLTNLANLDRNGKLSLIAADPKDIKFYDAANHLIAAGDNTTLAAYAIISQPDEIDVKAAGTITAESGNNIFLNADGEARISEVKGKEVRIRSNQGISNASNGSINIISDDLVLTAENGAIGAANKALVLSLKDGSIIRALARDGVYLNQQASAGRCGALNLDYINTPGNVGLQAADSILHTNNGYTFDIYCADLNLRAGGSIGSTASSVRLEQGNGSLKAVAGNGVFLEELTGDMMIDTVDAGNGDVELKTPGSIMAAANDGHTAVTGNSINLTACNGQVGEQAKVLVIDSSSAGPGLVGINALDDIYIKEAAGTLNLGLVKSINKGRVHMAGAGAIANGTGGTNVDAGLLKLEAVSGAGLPGSPIKTAVNRIEGSGGTGGFYIDNQGHLIVGGVDSINGIQADGSIQLVAHSPITIEEDVAAGGDINITAGPSAGLDDLVLAQDRKVQAGGSITLAAADNIIINPNAIIDAANDINAQASNNLVLTAATVDGGGAVLLQGANIPVTANSLIKAGGAMSLDASGNLSILNSVLDGENTIDMTSATYVTVNESTLDGSGSITIRANGGSVTLNNAVIKSANNIDARASGDVIITTATVDSGGAVLLQGVNIPVMANSLIKAGGVMSLDASGNLSILNSVLDGENTIDMTSATYVTIDHATVDGTGITINANGGALTITDTTVTSADNMVAQASDDINMIRAAVNSSQNTNILGGRNISFTAGIVNAGDSIDIKAADNILIDTNSALSAINNLRMAGDFGNNDAGTGCTIEIYGALTGLYMEARGECDMDEFIITDAAIAGPLTLLGGSGNDLYTVTNLRSISTMHNGTKDRVTMNGQEGSDVYVVNLVGDHDYIVEALDTGITGTDKLTLNGTPNADTLLLRQKFIANLHGEEVERVNYDQNIENLYIYSFAGKDAFYLDDNSALTEIYGAEDDDMFQIGQMFGSARDANAGVAPGDEITTVLTTRGYLSRGISYVTKIYGSSGNDSFTVYSNQANLVLEGEEGNDIFVIRAFALADPDNPSQPRTAVNGGNGDDHIEYNINSLVDIDGGEGNDTIRIIGSEFDDVFVISINGIVGAGLNVKSGEVECYEAYGMEGNDTFYIQGTQAGMVTKVLGGYGSDSFYILGDVTRYVSTSGTYDKMVNHDLDLIKGTLIIEGGVSNEGADCVLMAGVTLPTETNPDLSDVPAVDESKMTDSLYVYNDDSSGGDTGSLTVGHLEGLGMGTGTTLNEGSPENPQYVDYSGGIVFYNLEVLEILLGSGDDTFNIDSTSPGTITALHGGGGKDKIIARGCGGPLVIYGDTDAQDQRYFGVQGTPSANGHCFDNPAEDHIDAGLYLNFTSIYGGPGDDYIIGTGLNDCLAGGPGSDGIDGGIGDDLIYGDSGFNVDLHNRSLHVYNPWSCGSDLLDGGDGDDIIMGDYGAACYLSLRNSTLDAQQAEIRTEGFEGGDDYILGGSGDDVLIGGPGCDTIDGQTGNDLIFGDNAVENPYGRFMALMPSPSLQIVEEVEVIRYTNYRLPDSEKDWWTKLFMIMPAPSEKMEDQPDFENLVVIRYSSYREQKSRYLGVINQPQSLAPWWAKLPFMLKGDSYGDNDYLAGGPGHDVILGQSGDDTILGDGSVQGNLVMVRVIDGEISEIYPSVSAITDGHDYIEGGSGNDTIFGNGGNDDIIGGRSDFFWHESDSIESAGEDIIFGGSGTAIETSRPGNDTGTAKGDDDAILGDNGNIYRVLLGEQGTVLFLNPQTGLITRRAFEPLDYAPLKGELYRSPEVYDRAPGDIIHGERGDDFIHGMVKDDFLYGEEGNDHIIGGSGYDRIFGGSGQNRIIENDFYSHI